MKIVLFICTTLATSILALAIANPKTAYDLKLELSIDGKKVSSPKFLVSAGHTASVSQKLDDFERFIEVSADEGEINGRKGILMKFVIGTISADGQRIILAEPRILSRENEKAQVIVDPAGDNSHLELTVVASKTIL